MSGDGGAAGRVFPTTEVDDALDRLATAAAQDATAKVEAQIPDVVARLAAAHVDVIVLKGPVTRERLYGDTERRPVADIDLLANPKSFRRASRHLHAQGYRRTDRHGHSDAFTRDDDEPDIDLHLTLPYIRCSPKRAFAVFADHRVSLLVAGTAVPVLDEPAHVVHLAIHAAVNRFDPDQRSFTEWQRGVESLDAAELDVARSVASKLGVEPVWTLARRALDSTESRAELVAALPVWEAVPRVRSIRGFLRSGTPLWVKWRDLQRLIALQCSDGALNEWRIRRGREPLSPGTWRIRLEKPVRLVAVSVAGAARILGRRQPTS